MSKPLALGSSILIASSSIDEPTWRPVADKLDRRGFDVIAYEADKVADGSVEFSAQVSNTNGVAIVYNGRILDPAVIRAAWYRRPTMFAEEQDDKARQVSLDLERNAIQHAVWNMLPEDTWLSSPQRIARAERKLTQLLLANELGFKIPDTIVTNTWSNVHEQLPQRIIFKPSYGMFYDRTGLKILYVSPLDNKPDALPTNGVPYPGFWQPYTSKTREWRITVAGDQSFDAAIYTDNEARDDWRKHQLSTNLVRFEAACFPDEQKERCFQYLGRLGIRFGCFDFIENEDGITFLECNANGQFGWLEDELGFPISTAIADALQDIAQAA
jgi:hypothetical protein